MFASQSLSQSRKMCSSGGRSTIAFVWFNFKNSLRWRQRTGNLMGEDYFGNKYFEIPPQPKVGKRRAERWFVPTGNVDINFDQELTAEWEAWLRYRRADPPTEEELSQNLAIMKMKKINAAKLEEKYSDGKTKVPQVVTGSGTFPKYDTYEISPGKCLKDEKD